VLDETLDTIKGIKLFQSKKGYRFSVDALLLEDFISQNWWKDRSRIYDGMEIGTGSGIISILLAKRNKNTRIKAVEIQESLAELAKRNVELNHLANSIEIINSDIRETVKTLSPGVFDYVFSNPPFRRQKTGLLNRNMERAIARHEIKITLSDIIETASYLLKNRGRFYIIYHPFRLMDLICILKEKGLEPKRMRFVHSRACEEARMVMIEASKRGRTWLKVDPPLYIYNDNDEYSDEMKRIYI